MKSSVLIVALAYCGTLSKSRNSMPDEPYKATGRQLEVQPEARGLSFDVWLSKQTICDSRELAKWLRERREAEVKAEKGKKKVGSGALPENAEWL